MAKLGVELVPVTCWYSNVRSGLPTKEWDRLRKLSYAEADYKCEICGGKGTKHPVECHEIFEYDDENKVQTLRGLVALCPKCHRVKHIGKAQIDGLYGEARQHLADVNGWSIAKAEKYVIQQFEVWQKRSMYQWKLDLGWLKG